MPPCATPAILQEPVWSCTMSQWQPFSWAPWKQQTPTARQTCSSSWSTQWPPDNFLTSSWPLFIGDTPYDLLSSDGKYSPAHQRRNLWFGAALDTWHYHHDTVTITDHLVNDYDDLHEFLLWIFVQGQKSGYQERQFYWRNTDLVEPTKSGPGPDVMDLTTEEPCQAASSSERYTHYYDDTH